MLIKDSFFSFIHTFGKNYLTLPPSFPLFLPDGQSERSTDPPYGLSFISPICWRLTQLHAHPWISEAHKLAWCPRGAGPIVHKKKKHYLVFYLKNPHRPVILSQHPFFNLNTLKQEQALKHVCTHCWTHGLAHVHTHTPAQSSRRRRSSRGSLSLGFLQLQSILRSQCIIFARPAAALLSCPQAVCFWRGWGIQAAWTHRTWVLWLSHTAA